jgi:hypothetical protein
MKKTILLAAILLAALAGSGQNFTLNYDAITIEHQNGHQNQLAAGAIVLTKSMVKWTNGHAEDLFYMGETKIDYPGLGECHRHTWSRVEDIGRVYISLFIVQKRPYQLAVKVNNHVFRIDDKLIRKDSLIFYTDTNEDSVAGVQN